MKWITAGWMLALCVALWLCLSPRHFPDSFHGMLRPAWSFGALAFVHTVLSVVMLPPALQALDRRTDQFSLVLTVTAGAGILAIPAAYVSDIDGMQALRMLGWQLSLAAGIAGIVSFSRRFGSMFGAVTSILFFLTAGIPLGYYASVEYGSPLHEAWLLLSPVGMTRAVLLWPEALHVPLVAAHWLLPLSLALWFWGKPRRRKPEAVA